MINVLMGFGALILLVVISLGIVILADVIANKNNNKEVK